MAASKTHHKEKPETPKAILRYFVTFYIYFRSGSLLIRRAIPIPARPWLRRFGYARSARLRGAQNRSISSQGHGLRNAAQNGPVELQSARSRYSFFMRAHETL